VHDVPPPRAARLISEEEQAKLEAELAAIRNRMNTQAGGSQREQPRGAR
jgi:hypothetical protein